MASAVIPLFDAASWLSNLGVELLLADPTRPETRTLYGACLCWLIVELIFYLYLRHQAIHRFNPLSTPVPNPRDPEALWRLLHDTMFLVKEYYSLDKFISKWFMDADPDLVYIGNFQELLSWAIWAKPFPELKPEEKEMVDRWINEAQVNFNRPLTAGYNPDVDSCRMTLQPFQYLHRPLISYFFIWAFQTVGAAVLVLFGFERLTTGGMTYWYREGPPQSDRVPLLFFHGISPGLCVYLQMAISMARGRTSILFELPHISMCLQDFQPLKRPQVLEAIDSICTRHKIDRVCVAGHSFGSVYSGWLATHRPNLVAQMVIMDPVCLLLFLPDVCYNFLYRKPRNWMEYVISLLAAQEVTISNALRRHFWWYENLCMLEDVKCPVTVCLASNDEVAPGDVMRIYVSHMANECNKPQGWIDTVWWWNYSHGQCLTSPKAIHDVVQATREQELRYGITNKKPQDVAVTKGLSMEGREDYEDDETDSMTSGESSDL